MTTPTSLRYMDCDENKSSKDLYRVSVKVPPFWPDKPALWFAQLEGQFALSNITTDDTKFYHVIAQLENRYAVEVEDIITKPPSTNKYEELKTQLITRLSATQEQRVRQLLSHEELGDRKPSQFLRHLKTLAGADVPDDFLRSLWSSRLPAHIQAIIATQINSSLEIVAQLADKINEVTPQPRAAQVSVALPGPSTSAEPSAIDMLTRRIDDLTRQVAALSTGRTCHDSRSRSRSNSRTRRWRTRSNSRSKGWCWYHSKFQNRATKCRAPCTYSAGNEGSSH